MIARRLGFDSTRELVVTLASALALALAVAFGVVVTVTEAAGQEVRIRDLTVPESAVPVRLVGYGLVVGLDGTGDRVVGGIGAGHTVQSVVNLLRNFNIEVPANVLRTRNVAAVLVTAETSPYLRPGGRFEVSVSSAGDAVSLRGGVLWATPLVAEAGGTPFATAQGPVVISDGSAGRGGYVVETTGRIPGGGVLETGLPPVNFASTSRLLLREPNLGTASRIATAINGALGTGTATVEDPGSVALAPGDGDRAAFLTSIGELTVQPDRAAQIIVDARDGTVMAGGGLVVGEAVVSHGLVTLTVGAPGGAAGGAPREIRMAAGAAVQDVAAALQAIGAPAPVIAAIFGSLQQVGALAAQVVVR